MSAKCIDDVRPLSEKTGNDICICPTIYRQQLIFTTTASHRL